MKIQASDGTPYHENLAIIEMLTNFFATFLGSGQFIESQDGTISFPQPYSGKSANELLFTGLCDVGDSDKTFTIWVSEPLEVYLMAYYMMVPGLKELTLAPMKKWFYLPWPDDKGSSWKV